MFAQAGTFYEVMPGDRQTLVNASRHGDNPFRPAPAELAIEYTDMSATAAPVSSVRASQPETARSLQEQLALLKQLHEQGLITDEDYRTKKQQLQDRL